MPPRYKDISECRSEIKDYAGQLDSGTHNADPELRDEDSTRRYKQDLRWYDHWLDDAGNRISHRCGVLSCEPSWADSFKRI